jgi:glucokinase
MAKHKYTIGIDLGGTKILSGVVDDKGKIIGRAKKTTHADKGPDEVISRIVKCMEEALDESGVTKKDIGGIGIGAPGIIDSKTAVVKRATNFKGFDNVEVGKLLRAWHDVPVMLSNDVRVAAIGEQRMGAGKGVNSLIAVFVGTGIGGGIILDGKVWEGFRGSAGEVGHVVTVADGPFQGDNSIRGGIEAVASRTAIERDLRWGMYHGRNSVLTDLMAEKGGALTSSVLAKAVAKNDPLTIQVLTRAAYYLGLHAASLLNILDVEMLIYGGGIIEGLGKWIIPQIHEIAMQHCINQVGREKIKIVEAVLGEEAGVVGSALMVRDAGG